MASVKISKHQASVKMTGKDAYTLKVLPGQDAAFQVGLVTIVDELFYD